ncbi:hypothetical protein MRB53_027107 [Persea americana]|uniref:Uncharacterized protein n=1 Tax=Persea americana TaxID=3435 RepID=A0ACC2LL77_PERAE|nr:hypothetical protein MRB53_027107 [Persea americana]|eukprot:TRINITY_DN15211_c0_g2_i1.p1 TRINITY_DN15211_c0_g2~~TRINITY_DN15211_c0_g2_i1.p1  ORF type:complete len:1421 (-),score=348.34 TRINITY_DN15211_c0_g2_i1:941-5203(-)
MTKDSCPDKVSPSTSVTAGAGFSQKSELLDSPSSKDVYTGDNSQYVLLPHSLAQSSNEFFSRGDSKDLEENSSSQNQAEPFECSIELVASSLTEPVTNNSINGQKSPALDSCIFSKNKETPLQSQTEESDIMEDDVKVCDICGDAGREEMLAICSKCSDGAEHTYCMRIMLDKVPEGDWLCEECQLKEDDEKQKLDRTKIITATPNETPSKESFEGILNSKLLPKLDTKSEEAELSNASKVSASSLLSAKRHADNFEDSSSKSRKLAVDTSPGAPRIGSPGRKPALSRESSFKTMDVDKVKKANLVPSSGSQSANNSKEVARSPSTAGPDSSRVQAQLQLPRGLLSRSATFNNASSKPKVKQLVEDAFQKHRSSRESSSSATRKEGLITKSMSFRTPNSGRSTMIESKAKMPSPNVSRLEDPRGLKQAKGQNILERKNSFKMDRHVVGSLAGGTSMSLPKANPKNVFRGESTSSITSVKNSFDPNIKQREGKLNSSNSSLSSVHKGSEDALVSDGFGEMKKLSSLLSSRVGIPISKVKPTSAERKPYQVGPKEDTMGSSCVADESCGNLDAVVHDGSRQSHDSTNQDGKAKDSSAFRSSKQVTLSTGKNIRCHRCNEVGHIAQFCTASNLLLQASAVRKSGEVSNKNSKWKDAVEAISRTRHKDIRLLDQSDDLSMSSTNLSGEVAPKDQLSSSSSCVRNLSSLERTSDGQEAMRSATADARTMAIIDDKQHSIHLTETPCASREVNLNAISTISDELKMKGMSSQASLTAYSLRISAIPEHDYIWQGGFELWRSGRLTDYFGGIQAHISTCASRRVLEVVKKFPSKFRLEEVPRLSSWPKQFQGKATEDNIALYFFAKDLESYDKNYKKLLDNMLKNDLALKGDVNGIEILILPSIQLPEKSERWNRLFFLWAVFLERRVSCSESLSGSQKRLCRSSLDLESPVQSLVMDEQNTCQKTCSYEQEEKEFCPYDGSPKAPEAVSSTTVDFPFLSSKRGDENCYKNTSVHNQKPMNFHEHSHVAIDGAHSSEKQASFSVPEIHSSATVSQLASLHDGSSLSSISMTNEQICPEVKGDKTSLKEVYRDSKIEKDAQLQPCVEPAAVQNGFSKGKLVVLDSDSSNCRRAGLSSSAADGRDTSYISSKMFQGGSSSFAEQAGAGERLIDNVTCRDAERRKEPTEKDRSSWELSPSMKLPHSSFPRSFSETSGEISKESSKTMLWEDESCFQVDRENSCKKMKNCNDVNFESSSHERIFGDGSSKMLDLDFKDQKGAYAYDNTIDLENLITTERYLFPVDTGHVRDLKSGNSIPLQVLSSDEEDLPETDVPNLELALWGEKKRSKRGVSPLLGQVMDEKSNQSKLLDPATDGNNDDDLSASLSLSLSLPFSKKEQTAKSVTKTEQLLPKGHHVNTSLLLFGGFTET